MSDRKSDRISDGTKEIDTYVQSVLHRTFLTKQEKQSLAEEMRCHLHEAVEAADTAEAASDSARSHDHDAVQEAIRAFGTARAVRQQVIRETFGLSPWWFTAGAGLSFAVWVLSWFVNMRVADVIPSTLTPIPTPVWVLFLVRHTPMSSSMWMVLTVLCLMMLATRKSRDRAAVFSVGLFLVLLRALPLPLNLHLGVAALLFSPGSSGWIQPFSIPSLIGYVFLFASALATYAWTKSRMVSLTLLCVTIGLSVGPLLTNSLQETLWLRTGNGIFWGIQFRAMDILVGDGISVALRLLVVVAFLRVARWLDGQGVRVSEPA